VPLQQSTSRCGIYSVKFAVNQFINCSAAYAPTNITAEQMKAAIAPFEKIRQAVGDRMEIMVEFHSLWNLPTAKKIAAALAPYAPTWFEDPIRMNSPQSLAEYARSTDVWVCASETLGSRWAYKEFLERDAIHVAWSISVGPAV
jgi:L-alanine-DL-glutamate epimerase-like enolase superfamily enzyme